MLITQADLARAADVSRKTITLWKKRGTVVMQGDLVDLERTVAKFRMYKKDGSALAEKVTAAVRESVTGNEPPVTGVTTDGEITPLPDAHLTDSRDRAAVALLPVTAYRIGAVAALVGYELGVPREVAEKLGNQVTISAMEGVCMILDEAGVFPPPGVDTWHDAALFDTDKVATVNWRKVTAGSETAS